MNESHTPIPPGLCIERRRDCLYVYARVRRGGKLHSRYVCPIGPGEAALLLARARAEREARREAAHATRSRSAGVLAAGAEFDRLADQVTRTTMYLGGYHLHKRTQWRKSRSPTAMTDALDRVDPQLAALTRQPRPPHLPVGAATEAQAELFARAARGDRASLTEVRALLADPRTLATFGDVAAHARLSLVHRVAGDHLVVAEAVQAKLAEVEAGLVADCGAEPTVAERLAATRVAHAWLTVHHLEVLLAKEAVGSPGRTAVEKDLGRAEARLNAALKGLAVLRRLRGPAVRMTQVNVAAEKVVVR